MLGLNTKSMIRHGGVGAFAMVTIVSLFGLSYSAIAFPIAMTSLALSKQNITIGTFGKTFKLMITYSIIVLLSFLSSTHPYLGIPINFICLFLIGYFLTIRFNPVFYKPFLMLYVFTSFGDSTFSSLLTKIIIVNYGVIIVILSERILYKSNHKNLFISSILKSLSIVAEMLNSKTEEDKKSSLLKNLTFLRGFWYTLYLTRYKRALTTNLGKIQFNALTNLQSLCFFCFDHTFSPWEKSLMLSEIKKIQDINYTFSSPLSFYCETIQNDIHLINSLTKKEEKRLLLDIKKSEFDSLLSIGREDFKLGSIRMNFALRLSILLTISLFLGTILSYYKIVWVSITIMSIIYPYYEETLSRITQRLKGNILGIILISIIFSLTNSKELTFAIMVLSVFLTYGFKDYSKLSFCTTIASLSAASFLTPVNELAILRIFYVLIGALTVFIANRFLFPYKLERGVMHLIRNILRYNSLLAVELLNDNKSISADIVILTYLNIEKLNLRNMHFHCDNINEFILVDSRIITHLCENI